MEKSKNPKDGAKSTIASRFSNTIDVLGLDRQRRMEAKWAAKKKKMEEKKKESDERQDK